MFLNKLVVGVVLLLLELVYVCDAFAFAFPPNVLMCTMTLAPATLCHIKIRYAPEVREQNTQTLSLRNGL